MPKATKTFMYLLKRNKLFFWNSTRAGHKLMTIFYVRQSLEPKY
jgi:hypothetical protein